MTLIEAFKKQDCNFYLYFLSFFFHFIRFFFNETHSCSITMNKAQNNVALSETLIHAPILVCRCQVFVTDYMSNKTQENKNRRSLNYTYNTLLYFAPNHSIPCSFYFDLASFFSI